MRGTANQAGASLGVLGIIPACAGNRTSCFVTKQLLRDHPRVCGEQGQRVPPNPRKGGSSPRVRGTDSRLIFRCNNGGIIPACAGNRVSRVTKMHSRRDHPRVCGEQNSFAYMVRQSEGSSPRVRGTDDLRHTYATIAGIIPACAGNRKQQQRH